MHSPRWSVALRVAIGLYLVGIGALAGVLTERVRYDQARTAVVTRYQHALRQWQAVLMDIERVTSGPSDPACRVSDTAVDVRS